MKATDYEIVDAKAKIMASVRLLRDISQQTVLDLGADDYLNTVHKLERYHENLWAEISKRPVGKEPEPPTEEEQS